MERIRDILIDGEIEVGSLEEVRAIFIRFGNGGDGEKWMDL